jgi:hypothetical protein
VLQARLEKALGSERAGTLNDASTSTDDGVTGFEVSSELLIVGLQERIAAIVKNGGDFDVVLDAKANAEHCDSVGGGLHHIFLTAFAPPAGADKWSVVRTGVLLEQALHMASHKHSATQWALSDYLMMAGVSRTYRMGLFHLGIGMCPSKQLHRVEQVISEADSEIASMLEESGKVFMCVYDDFNSHRRTSVMTKEQRMSVSIDVTNVILKDITGTGLDLRVGHVSGPLLPVLFSHDLVVPFFERQWENHSMRTAYWPARSECNAALCRVLKPYGGEQRMHEGSPVSLDNVLLLKSLQHKFATSEGQHEVLTFMSEALAPYLSHSYMILTGDWHAYWGAMEAVCCKREGFEHVVPLPGPFHMGLNLQEAILEWFLPILNPLWKSVAGKYFDTPVPPLQRKNALDLLCRSWDRCRTVCIELADSGRYCPVEARMMVELFDELIPLSLDLYTCYLFGTWDEYEELLRRALHVFIQFGKSNYVHAVLLFLATVEHWKRTNPAVYERFTRNFRLFSEEEIELYHSTTRNYAAKQKSALELSRAINFHAAKHAQMEGWMAELVGMTHGGQCVDNMEDGEERMSEKIASLFRGVVGSERSCEYDMRRGLWVSGRLRDALGVTEDVMFSDRCLPLALQHSGAVYGFPELDVSIGKTTHEGAVSTRLRRCGHRAGANVMCEACETIDRFVSEAVFDGLRM